MTTLISEILIIEDSELNNFKLHNALDNIYQQNIDFDIIEWLIKGAVNKHELEEAIEFSKKYKKYYKKELDLFFCKKKIYLSDYDFNIELHKSKFLVDILSNIYKFSIINNDIIIYKKTKDSNIDIEISRVDFIYEVQIELHEYFEITHNFDKVIKEFYILFGKINDLNKAIDNIKYLKKILN